MAPAPTSEKEVKVVGIVRDVKWSGSGGSLTLKTRPSKTTNTGSVNIPIRHYNTAVELRRLRSLKVELLLENDRIIGIRTLPMTEADWE